MRKDSNGWAEWGRWVGRNSLPPYVKKCVLSTRNYPLEMGHEITYCFSGNFHSSKETDEYKASIWW